MTDAADSPYSSSSSLATPRPSADAADEPSSPAAPIFQTLSEIMYASHGRSLKALAVLSLGLKNNDGSPTFDPSVLPWSAALRPSALKMTAKDLRDEVKRRSEAAGDDALTAPRPKQWTVGKATEWLEANPIAADDEMPSFITLFNIESMLLSERPFLMQQLLWRPLLPMVVLVIGLGNIPTYD